MANSVLDKGVKGSAIIEIADGSWARTRLYGCYFVYLEPEHPGQLWAAIPGEGGVGQRSLEQSANSSICAVSDAAITRTLQSSPSAPECQFFVDGLLQVLVHESIKSLGAPGQPRAGV
jgi:hypothetical protein